MLVILLAVSTAAPVYPDPLAVGMAAYTDCSPALWSEPVYCSVMVPTGSQLMCCEAAVQTPEKRVHRECVTSAGIKSTADKCPVLLKAGEASWCCNLSEMEQPHMRFYPWGDDGDFDL